MTAPSVTNLTPFAFEYMGLMDEAGRPLLVVVIKATYQIIPEHGVLELAKKQLVVNTEGETWGDPESSSFKYEPETAFFKPATDVVLIGHACAQQHYQTTMDVSLRVGPIMKMVRVVGDRYWYKTLGVTSMTKPSPINRIPLIYERAFGGWDRSDPDTDKHSFEASNPVGTGFRKKRGKFEEKVKLPNLEDPLHPLRSYTGRPPPTGFGFISPHWEPRLSLAGTLDQSWVESYMPRLPKDFSIRFFNAAPTDQIAPSYLRGDEQVLITGTYNHGNLSCHLPGVPPPDCLVAAKHIKDTLLESNLDTIIINTDENMLFMIWRANLLLRDGPQDVTSIEIRQHAI